MALKTLALAELVTTIDGLSVAGAAAILAETARRRARVKLAMTPAVAPTSPVARPVQRTWASAEIPSRALGAADSTVADAGGLG